MYYIVIHIKSQKYMLICIGVIINAQTTGSNL